MDASVGAKWCMPIAGEDLLPEALALLEAFRGGQSRVVVPELFWTEITSALWKAVRRSKLSLSDAASALSWLQKTEIVSVSTSHLLTHALSVAARYNRTVYDCVYVALALESGMELITADERLANALAAYFPVKWLGAFSA